LVNSTSTEQKVNLNGEFEALKGSQDLTINNGAVIRTITLKPNDGRILRKRIEMIYDQDFTNGSFVRVFDKYGQTVRNGFFLYDHKYVGSSNMIKSDINADGQIEIIAADKQKITVYNSGMTVLSSFYPYGPTYNKGINLAVGDFDRDGKKEIVTGTQRGGGPQVRIFRADGTIYRDGFFAYNKNFRGGVNIAVGDTNGNGDLEIITGAGYMGGPQVRIFNADGKVLSGGFFAYGQNFRGGVYVACGDIDGDKKDEIVTGAGSGGSSQVRIFNSKFEPINPGFWAFEKNSKDGVQVFLGDLDLDGKKEILAASPSPFNYMFSNR